MAFWRRSNKIRLSILWGFLAIIVYMLPYCILGQNTWMRVEENLDCEVVYRAFLAHNGLMFRTGAVIPQIINGLPRDCLMSGYNFVSWLFMLFSPFVAYVINEFLVRCCAFLGMFLLLRQHVLKKEEGVMPIFVPALFFALLPINHMNGLSIVGQPLLLYAFLNIRNRQQHFHDFLIIVLFPFYSPFVFSGVFIVCALGMLLVWDSVKNKCINWNFLEKLLVLVVLYLLVEHGLIVLMFFDPTFIAHRVEFNALPFAYSIPEIFTTGFVFFVGGGWQIQSLHAPILFFVTCVLAVLLVRKQLRTQRFARSLLWLFVGTFCLSFMSGIVMQKDIIELRNHVTFFRMFNVERFSYFIATLWYVIFALLLAILVCRKYPRWIIFLIIASQFFYLAKNSPEQRRNLASLLVKASLPSGAIAKLDDSPQCMTYKRYVAQTVFSEIREYVARPQQDYRIVSVGVLPDVALMNGFYVLDFCWNLYPLSYKHQFRPLFEKELEKNSFNQKLFDYWGNACYIFPAHPNGAVFENLELNTRLLRSMGGEYIFSTKPIIGGCEKNLTFLRKFADKDSAWTIYLYKVKP